MIVALTADAFDESKEYLLNNGMDDFLSKPVVLESLKNVLKRCYVKKIQKKHL